MVTITIRLEDMPRRKLKVIAGYEDLSLNGVIIQAIDEKIASYEERHGVIRIPE